MADGKKAELSFSQKAAAGIVSLGTGKGSLLYQYMGPEELGQLTLGGGRLG